MTTHTHTRRTTPAFGISASPTFPGPLWSVTLEFAPQPSMDKAAFLKFDRYMRDMAAIYLDAPVGGTNAGPNV